MASDGDTLVVGLVDRAVLLDPRTGRLLRTFPGVAGSERGSPASILETAGLVAVGNAEGANLHDATTGAVVRTISTQNDVTSMAVAPSEDQLVFGTVEGTEVWNVDGTPVGRLVGQANDTRSVALHPDGRHAFSVSLDGTGGAVGRQRPRRRSFSRVDGNEPLRGAEVSSRGPRPHRRRRLLRAADGDPVRDGGTGGWVEPIETPLSNPTAPDDAAVSSVDWSADGRLLAVGTGWGHVALYDRGTGESLADWTESRGRSVMHVQFSPDGSTLAVGLASDVLDGEVPESDRGPDVVFLDADALELVDAIEVPEIGFGGHDGALRARWRSAARRPLLRLVRQPIGSAAARVRRALRPRDRSPVSRRETDVIDAGFASDGAASSSGAARPDRRARRHGRVRGRGLRRRP